mmetsp:Transcript_28458/g.59414  ORF Transcript_28458/g.59414 Transcript_28458/m.59414 type:complete len:94 (-) Transcript_28458:953-1234(-)
MILNPLVLHRKEFLVTRDSISLSYSLRPCTCVVIPTTTASHGEMCASIYDQNSPIDSFYSDNASVAERATRMASCKRAKVARNSTWASRDTRR